MIRTRHQVQGYDMLGAICFHAVRLDVDEWIATRPDGWNLVFYSRQRLIGALADLLMERRPTVGAPPDARLWNTCMRIESSYRRDLFEPIDLAGNMWAGGQYLTPAQYLPMLIPEEQVPHGNDS